MEDVAVLHLWSFVVWDAVWDCLGWGRDPLLRMGFGTAFGILGWLHTTGNFSSGFLQSIGGLSAY
jgi:hypothetical protein